MRNVNTLWCVVERFNDGESSVMPDEVFYSRRDARDYLRVVKSQKATAPNPRNLFIRQLRVTNKRG
jgi:hypothetical protein